MKYLIDLSIWIDVLLRPGQFPLSGKFIENCLERKELIVFPLCAYTTFLYLVNKKINIHEIHDFFDQLMLQGVLFGDFTQRELFITRNLSIKDPEDECIVATAMSNRCKYIVTRNIKDFKKSPIKVITP